MEERGRGTGAWTYFSCLDLLNIRDEQEPSKGPARNLQAHLGNSQAIAENHTVPK